MNEDNKISKISANKLKLVFVNGTVLNLERRDILVWLTEPTTSILIGAASSVFLIYFAYLGRQEYIPREVWQLAVSILVFVVFFFSLVLLTVFIAFYVLRFQPRFILPVPLVIVAAHVLNQLVSVLLLEFWEVNVPDSAILYLRVIKLYVLVLALEIFYSAYLLPRSRLFKERLFLHPSAETSTSATHRPVRTSPPTEPEEFFETLAEEETFQPKPEVSPPKTVYVGGHEFDRGAVRLIRAEQNYIQIETAANKVLVRATMKEAVDMLDCTLGVQAHRSCWVSFTCISKTRNIPNGKLSLELDDGDAIIVPRARRKEVRRAIEKHAPTRVPHVPSTAKDGHG